MGGEVPQYDAWQVYVPEAVINHQCVRALLYRNNQSLASSIMECFRRIVSCDGQASPCTSPSLHDTLSNDLTVHNTMSVTNL